MTDQNGEVYRYFRVDADHNVSNDVLELSLDAVTWTSVGVTFVAQVDWPPAVAADVVNNPPATGLAAYWWRAMSGPGQTLPLTTGLVTVRGRLHDVPELPWFAWAIDVGPYD